jgi:hypothetical protein
MALGATVTSEDSDHGIRHSLVLAAIIVLALVLRFWRLGDWGFEATEIFTLRDSITPPSSRNPRPLIYFLNYYLVRPVVPLDEFGLRLLPGIFGVLGVPVFYLVARRLAGTSAALFGAFLLAVSSIHVYYSQYARYWTLVFLLCSVYPYALYLGIRNSDRRALTIGVVTAILALLAHPVSSLPLGGLAVWVVVSYLRPSQVRRLWNQVGFRWGVLAGALVGMALLYRLVPMLRSWTFRHDVGKGGEFLFHLPSGAGVKQASYILAYVESLTVPVVLTGVLGIYLLSRRDRSLALLLGLVAIFPIAFLLLVSLRTAISLPYMLMPTGSVFFIGAGVFLGEMSRAAWTFRPRQLVPATLALIIVSTGAPTLISQYRDGRRYDFRAVARWLDQKLQPGDIVFSDQPRVLAHYLPGTPVHPLRADTTGLLHSVDLVRKSGSDGALWLVPPAPSHAFRTNPRIGVLNHWIYDHCQIRNSIGVPRLDFRQHYLQIYRCPPPA